MGPRERLVAGLMSGTSVDGIDVAIVRLSPSHEPELVTGAEVPFDHALRAMILDCAEPGGGDSRTIAGLHLRLAHAYADALSTVLTSSPLGLDTLDLIGCHGQTIAHWPNDPTPTTLQLGSGAALAALVGVPVVHDFRAADVALGGQGAPLIPWVDWRLFRAVAQERSIGVLNLGGIANMTLLPAGISAPDELVAFDTGPANMVIDGLARRLLDEPFDHDGRAAARGQVDYALLTQLLRHPFFARPLPRSTGREEFGDAYVRDLVGAAGARNLGPADVLATATALTAHSIAHALSLVAPHLRPAEIILGGGGARNATLVAMLADLLPGVAISRHEDYGWPSGLKEALGFALLADAAVRGEPTALPNVTGAPRPLVLGAIAPGRPPNVWPDWIATR